MANPSLLLLALLRVRLTRYVLERFPPLLKVGCSIWIFARSNSIQQNQGKGSDAKRSREAKVCDGSHYTKFSVGLDTDREWERKGRFYGRNADRGSIYPIRRESMANSGLPGFHSSSNCDDCCIQAFERVLAAFHSDLLLLFHYTTVAVILVTLARLTPDIAMSKKVELVSTQSESIRGFLKSESALAANARQSTQCIIN